MAKGTELVKYAGGRAWEEAFLAEPRTTPPVNLYEREDAFLLIATTPGVPKSDVRVAVEGEDIVIMAKGGDDLSTVEPIFEETPYGNFHRRIRVGRTIDLAKIEAVYDNGRLAITLPKRARPDGFEIEIE
jgi:HSP20 family protein